MVPRGALPQQPVPVILPLRRGLCKRYHSGAGVCKRLQCRAPPCADPPSAVARGALPLAWAVVAGTNRHPRSRPHETPRHRPARLRRRPRLVHARGRAGPHQRRHLRIRRRRVRGRRARRHRHAQRRGHRHEEGNHHERRGRVRVSRSQLRPLSDHGHAAGLPDRGLQQGHRRVVAHDRPAHQARRRLARADGHRGRRVAGPRDDVERHLLDAQQQGDHRAAPGRTQRVRLRAPRARRRRPGRHRQHALQRHAGRHDQPDDRRRQQLVERVQERRHELLRHRPGPARRHRRSDGRIGRPRRGRGRHGRREPEVRHAPRHQHLSRQPVRAVPHRQVERQQLQQQLPQPAEAGAAPPRLRRQPRRSAGAERRLERQAVLLRELRAGIHPADADPVADGAHGRSAARRLPLSDGFRRATDRQRARHRRAAGVPGDAGPDSRDAAVQAVRRAATRNGHQHEQPPHRAARVEPAAEADELLPDHAPGLPDPDEPGVDDELQPVQPASRRPAGLAGAWLSHSARHLRLRLVGLVNGVELVDQLEHAQRAPRGRAAQRRHQRARPRARALRAQRHRQRAAGAVYPAVRPGAVVGRQPAGHRQALHHDDLGHVDADARQPLVQPRRQLPRHPVARSGARRPRHRGISRAPALLHWIAGRRSGPVDLHRGNHAGRADGGSGRGDLALRAPHRAPLAGADRKGRRPGNAAVRRRRVHGELDLRLVCRRVRAGPLAYHAGLHAELRPALGGQPAAVQSHRDGRVPGLRQPARTVHRVVPARSAERRGQPCPEPRLQGREDRLDQLRAEGRLCVDAELQPGHPRRDLRAGRGDGIPRRLRRHLLRRRHEHVRRVGRQQSRPVAEPAAHARRAGLHPRRAHASHRRCRRSSRSRRPTRTCGISRSSRSARPASRR